MANWDNKCIIIEPGVEAVIQVPFERGNTWINNDGKMIIINFVTNDPSLTEEQHGFSNAIIISSNKLYNIETFTINTKYGTYYAYSYWKQNGLFDYWTETVYGCSIIVNGKTLDINNCVYSKDFFNINGDFWKYVSENMPALPDIKTRVKYYRYGNIQISYNVDEGLLNVFTHGHTIYKNWSPMRGAIFAVFSDNTKKEYKTFFASTDPTLANYNTGSEYKIERVLNSKKTVYFYPFANSENDSYDFAEEWYSNLVSYIPKDTHEFDAVTYLDNSTFGYYNDLNNPNSNLLIALDYVLNEYAPPTPSGKEFDFYYRTRYGAEFPWPEDPTPGPDVPGEPIIAGTLAHAGWKGSGSHNLEPSENSKVVDTVTYNGLTPGLTYTVVGMLYDKNIGDLIPESYTELDFVPEDVYGDTYVEINFDSSELAGHKLVVFESLYLDGILLFSYEDEEDTDETIYILAPSEQDEYNPDDDEEKPYFCAVDENFNALGIIDNYESLIWTDRFDRAGDFELYTTVNAELFNLLKVDNYFYIPQSDKHMIVEKISIASDVEDGDKLNITGRSLESIIDRRIVYKKTVINGNLQQGLKKIFEDNIINPPIGERRIANFIFKESTDSKITKLTLDAEYFGDNIYDLVSNVCQTNHIGFRIRLNSSNQFVFELYSGEDRSYDNPNNNTYIIFGPEYDNVNNCNYSENKENYKNVALAGTNSDDTSAWTTDHKSYSGLSRRETYISATDIDKDNMSTDQYKGALSDKGKEALKDYQNIKAFDGTMLNSNLIYLTDFNLGDIIEFKDIYGHEVKSRISEIIINHDSTGFRIYPSFEEVKE